MKFTPNTGVEKQFAWISSIPHGSYNERALSDALRERAEKAGLEVRQDEIGNVLIRKPAAKGCEDKAPVMLQAHMDMVCAQVAGGTHNFLTDPLNLLVDDEGWLYADGTTLGADDGYGCAYMLELLFGESGNIPEIECLFTVQEEVGLNGAAVFDTKQIKSRRLISMDGGGETSVVVSTAGGRRVNMTLPLKPKQADGRAWKLYVADLTGGHSGGVITKAHGNAIKILGYILAALEKTGAALVSFDGGEADNAVPRFAHAILRVPEADLENVRSIVAAMTARFTKQHKITDPHMSITLTEVESDATECYDPAAARLIVALPDGVRTMDPAKEGIIAISSNIGVLRMDGDKMMVQSMMRSSGPEWRDLLGDQMIATAEAFGCEWNVDSDYPGMEYNPDSEMRKTYAKLVKEIFDAELTESGTHGGMEIGYFATTIPGVDIVTHACVCSGAHTPNEKMKLESFNKSYGILVKFLEMLP